jgi:hypothetical protein
MNTGNPVMVRALFGDCLVDTWDKAKRDAQECLARGHLLPGTLVYAFGQVNSDLLGELGIAHRMLPCNPGEGVKDFLGLGTRKISGWRGSVNYGISIWRHKLEAVKLALCEQESVIWCDWDTRIIKLPDAALYALLAHGPEFQGRYRQYRRSMCLWRRNDKLPHERKAFHGACFYVRGQYMCDKAIGIMESEDYRLQIDEPVMTLAVDMKYFEGQLMRRVVPEPEQYRDAGIDNPRFHTTHRDVLKNPEGVRSYFAEGKVVKVFKHQIKQEPQI